jgi:hypothetical protein
VYYLAKHLAESDFTPACLNHVELTVELLRMFLLKQALLAHLANINVIGLLHFRTSTELPALAR